MKLSTFTAESASDAVRVVQENLGPDAVIVSVRKLSGGAFARLLHRGGQIEVTAGVPEVAGPLPASSPTASPNSAAAAYAQRHVVPPGVDAYTPFSEKVEAPDAPARLPHRWNSVMWLESLGLLPEYADRLEQKIISAHGTKPPANPVEEWHVVRDTLAAFWHPPRVTDDNPGRPHVFIGPPGSGKTTALCKWMTTAVLRGASKAKVWRLDAETANTAEFLTLHCEMLGVSCERFWAEPTGAEDLLFVDLPGVEPHGMKGLAVLRDTLFSLPQPRIHLVLNAAYDTQLLFEQFNAFAPLMPEDVIFTHLDEEHRRVKLWNFVLGTNCPLAWLGGGQKIPGEFTAADSKILFPHGKPA
jgi:flagellar biosynthesis protein FlhF